MKIHIILRKQTLNKEYRLCIIRNSKHNLIKKIIMFVVDFCPLWRLINLAIITKDEISIIKHARKSVLFNDGKPWTKKDSNSLFDVTMGSYDGAEICELVGLFILNKLGQKFGKENIGLYKDDGLAIMKSKSARLADKTRKELHKCFEQFGLKITAEANLHVVNFLDVTFDLNNGKFKPYRKPNDDLLYINRHWT